MDGYEELVDNANKEAEDYDPEKDRNIQADTDFRPAKREDLFEKGHSRRLWGELYKVLDSSDVVIQVLDARDPIGKHNLRL